MIDEHASDGHAGTAVGLDPGADRANRLALAAILACAAWMTVAAPALAQGFPSRPIRLLVGFTAGGPTDIPARFLADKLSASLGTPVVVENRPGAGSMLATNEMLGQPRDGHTLVVCTYFDPVNTLLYRKARYQVSDIAPVTLIARYDYAMAVAHSTPAATIAEFIALGKTEPGRLNYGQLGIASTQNLLAKQLEKLSGARMTAVTFKGSPEALQEVVAGRIDLYIGPPLVVMPLYEARQVKVLAVTGAARLSSAPEAPTLKESGVPLVAFAFLGVCAGSGTPQPIIAELNSRIRPIVEAADYRALIERSGSVPVASSPQEMQAVIDAAVRDAAPIITEFGLQVD